MRIRTDGDQAYRKDAIEAAADELDVNKTRAVVSSCELVGKLIPAIEDALEHEDLPPRVAREIVDEVAQESRNVEMSIVERNVTIEVS